MNPGKSQQRWVDNSTVTVASTCYSIQPFTNVKRYSKQEEKVVQFPQPNLSQKYNVSMGGSDLIDQNVPRYQSVFVKKNGGGAFLRGCYMSLSKMLGRSIITAKNQCGSQIFVAT
ncbi:hypothetical protein JTB14_029412 [Gonioctena quinquepunctata]|nr:hypothetical protein JTB14_029412 [Gonioctena quinquepunctata]